MNKIRGKIMSDHVKERAIGFAKWLDAEAWILDKDDIWHRYMQHNISLKVNDEPETATSEELYEQYLKTKNG